MTRAAIRPEMFVWALDRAGVERDDLVGRFAKLPEWMEGQRQPTLKQLQDFARAVHVPIGYLFMPAPPEELLPIPDFRTFDNQEVRRPSPNLLDTLYTCQERQAWYREYARTSRLEPKPFIGSVTTRAAAETVAADIRRTIGFDLDARRACPTWEDALRLFIRNAEDVGILVMVSGIVGSNTRRGLDPQEFRGFALSDELAPLVFINGKDTKSAQMFTLAHELAHLWLDASALSNATAASLSGRREEVWCNAVAAELLVPLVVFRTELNDEELLDQALRRLSRRFKVSTLVILRRLLDAQWLSRTEFEGAWASETARLRALMRAGGGGGNFSRATARRVSHPFARALIVSAQEGQTLYRDAFRMLGVSKAETFNNVGREVGVMA